MFISVNSNTLTGFRALVASEIAVIYAKMGCPDGPHLRWSTDEELKTATELLALILSGEGHDYSVADCCQFLVDSREIELNMREDEERC